MIIENKGWQNEKKTWFYNDRIASCISILGIIMIIAILAVVNYM